MITVFHYAFKYVSCECDVRADRILSRAIQTHTCTLIPFAFDGLWSTSMLGKNVKLFRSLSLALALVVEPLQFMRNQVGWWVWIKKRRKKKAEVNLTNLNLKNSFRPKSTSFHIASFYRLQISGRKYVVINFLLLRRHKRMRNVKMSNAQYRNCLMQRHVAFDLLHL